MQKLFTLLILAFSLGIVSSVSGAQAQEANPAQEPRNRGLRVELQKKGKTAAVVTCTGLGTLEQACRFDAATGTVFIDIPEGEMVFEGQNAIFDEKADTTTFPGQVTVRIRSREKIEMNVLVAAGAAVHLLPPTL